MVKKTVITLALLCAALFRAGGQDALQDAARQSVLEAVAAADAGDFSRAYRIISQVLDSEPTLDLAYEGASYIYFMANDGQSLRLLSERQLRHLPDSYRAYYMAAYSEVVFGTDYGRALELLEQAIELQPGFADSYHLRAAAHYIRGDYEAAQNDCDTFILLMQSSTGIPQSRLYVADAAIIRALSDAALDNRPEALADMAVAIKVNAENPEYYALRAFLCRTWAEDTGSAEERQYYLDIAATDGKRAQAAGLDPEKLSVSILNGMVTVGK